MVLESTVLLIDGSDYMRNGDFVPTRMQAQQDAINMITHAKLRSNPESNVALILCGEKTEVMTTLTTDAGKILSKMHGIEPNGNIHFTTGVQIAHLALKHRQGKHHKMRIIAFVGSPVAEDEKDLVKLARKLKKNLISVDVVNFGNEEENEQKLAKFVEACGGSSHIVNVQTGPIISDALMQSPVILGEDGQPPAGFGNGMEFGIDPDEDPELALALRVSMEEQRARQENANTAAVDQAVAESAPVPAPAAPAPAPANMDAMTEEEQLQMALKMSMADYMDVDSAPAAAPAPTATDTLMDDPEAMAQLLESLPGVDPNSQEVRDAMAAYRAQRDSEKK